MKGNDMIVSTLGELEKATGVRALDHLDRDALLPVATDLVAQGDVLLRRVERPEGLELGSEIPPTGWVVVRGEGGNTHALYGSGFVYESPFADDLVVGLLTVLPGDKAYLLHPEHGGYEVAEGTWELRRQREWAGEWQMVAD